MSNYENVDAALQRGELWRAKEILRGRVGRSEYDSLLFEKYGVILLRTADLYEAGKFLFLSGVRNEEYAQPIQLFVDRHRRRQPNRIWYAFPRHVQRMNITQWPKSVVEELANFGVDIESLQRARESYAFRKSSAKNKALLYFALVFLFVIIVAFFVGVGVGLKAILAWFF
ncbi:MAG: hypothetical protein Q8S00_01125 [Deltaproteobacteria bacterium]|nr:hypothetical protein [Deltaproteobacteria bacterium]